METTQMEFKLIVVSAFGRGQWIAAEMAKLGFKVTLLDVTENLGRWSPEDGEGPFGYFRTDKLSATQIERLLEEDYPEDIPQGFSFWLPSGPLELKGPIATYQLRSLGITQNTENYIYEFETASMKRRQEMTAELNVQTFQETWLARFAHQLASTVFVPNVDSLQFGSPRPMLAPFFIRHLTRPGYEKSLNWCRAQKVEVINKLNILDVSVVDRKHIEGIEISSDKTGLLKADQFVWCLSGQETEFINKTVAEKLFPKNVIEPEWSWLRGRVKLSGDVEKEVLPNYFVFQEDIHLPWAHENTVIFQKSQSADDYDVWMRVPTLHRFSRAYLTDRFDRVLNSLNRRMARTHAAMAHYPQEYQYTYEDLGPSRFPVFSLEQRKQFRESNFMNLALSTFETCDSYGWESYLISQNEIATNLQDWKKKIQAKLEKKQESRRKDIEA